MQPEPATPPKKVEDDEYYTPEELHRITKLSAQDIRAATQRISGNILKCITKRGNNYVYRQILGRHFREWQDREAQEDARPYGVLKHKPKQENRYAR